MESFVNPLYFYIMSMSRWCYKYKHKYRKLGLSCEIPKQTRLARIIGSVCESFSTFPTTHLLVRNFPIRWDAVVNNITISKAMNDKSVCWRVPGNRTGRRVTKTLPGLARSASCPSSTLAILYCCSTHSLQTIVFAKG